MKVIKKFLIITLSLFLAVIIPSIPYASEKHKVLSISTYMDNELKISHIPGAAIGIVQEDKIICAQGYGKSDDNTLITPTTPFEIGSVSKSFTALAIMQLKEKNLIDLDSPIDKYISWFEAYYENSPAEITVRQLLNQNSGIPVFFDNDASPDLSIEEVTKQYLNNSNLKSAPGTEFLYSNANYIILGEIVQAVSGLSYEEYVQQYIFTPLEMNYSYLSKEEAMKNGLSAGYRQWFSYPVKADLPYFKGNIPCGHIISCAEDMCHYLLIFLNGGKYKDNVLLSPEGINELIYPAVKTFVPIGTDADESFYGMGWGINYKNNELFSIEHSGETSNYHAHALINPKENTAVIELDNLGGYITDSSIVSCVMSIVTCDKQPSSYQNISNIFKIINVIFLIILILLVTSLIRLRSFKQRLNKYFKFNIIFAIIVNMIMPLILIIFGPVILGGTTWNSILIFSPDISLVLLASCIIMIFEGIIKGKIIIKQLKK